GRYGQGPDAVGAEEDARGARRDRRGAGVSCPHTVDAAAYLLGALEGEERVAFREHAAGCAACQRELAELRAVTDTLPLAASPAAPPAELKSAVMAEVRAQAQLLRAAEEP